MDIKELKKELETVKKDRVKLSKQLEESAAREADIMRKLSDPANYSNAEAMERDQAEAAREKNNRAILSARLEHATTPEDGSAAYRCLNAKREAYYKDACDRILKLEKEIDAILADIDEEDRAIMALYNEYRQLAPYPGRYAIMNTLTGRGVFLRSKRYIQNIEQIQDNIYI